MDKSMVETLEKLESELGAVPDLPVAAPKTVAQKIEELHGQIQSFQERRQRLIAKDKLDEFDRMSFSLAKERLAKELNRLKEQAAA